jgi:hypothetical protein
LVMAETKHCPSIPKTRWLYATDSLRWIQVHIPNIQIIITVYRNGDDLEIQRARNPVLNILAADHDDDQFQAMEDCLSLLQLLRSLCNRFEQRNASGASGPRNARDMSEFILSTSLTTTQLWDSKAHSFQVHHSNGNEHWRPVHHSVRLKSWRKKRDSRTRSRVYDCGRVFMRGLAWGTQWFCAPTRLI